MSETRYVPITFVGGPDDGKTYLLGKESSVIALAEMDPWGRLVWLGQYVRGEAEDSGRMFWCEASA